jgi:hypothetical protein
LSGQAWRNGDGARNLTTHSTGARIEWLSSSFLVAMVECYSPRPVNSGVMPLSRLISKRYL